MRATMQRRFLGCMLFRPTLEAVIDKTVFATPQRNPTLLRKFCLRTSWHTKSGICCWVQQTRAFRR